MPAISPSAAVAQLVADQPLFHQVLHGPAAGEGSTVETEGNPVQPTVAKAITDAVALIDGAGEYTPSDAPAPRSVSAKLKEWVSIEDFGSNDDPGVTDMTAAVNAALATGRHVELGYGPHRITDSAIISEPHQTLYGRGELAELVCDFATPKIGVQILQNGGGEQTVENLLIRGVSNVSKLVSVAGAEVMLHKVRMVNGTGHVVFVENEVSDPGDTYGFGLQMIDCKVYGKLASGFYGVRLGLYSQCFHMRGGRLENCGTLFKVEGAVTNVTIDNTILQRSVDYAIDLDKAGATPIMASMQFHKLYSEQNRIFAHAKGGEFHAISFSDIYAYRNGTVEDKAGSAFFKGDAGALANSNGFVFENIEVEDFAAVFSLNDAYTSLFKSVRNIREISTSGDAGVYAVGDFADNAYECRTVNQYFSNKKFTSGALTDDGINRCDAKNCTMLVPLPDLGSRDYLEKITFYYLSIDGTGITVELRSMPSRGTSDALEATSGPTNTDGVKTISFGGQLDPAKNYYLKVIWDNVGTVGYLYPFQLFFRG